MRLNLFRTITYIYLLTSAFISFATHNRAGEIQLIPVDGSCTKFKAIVTTYTKESSPADRPELTIRWGDGDSSVINRINGNGNGVSLGNDIKYNVYEGVHNYVGAGAEYTVSIEDPNRNAGVINIDNSVQVRFFIYAKVFINPFLGGCNSNPRLLNPPIDDACFCKKYIHNPGADDPEGDSLSYELVRCLGEDGNPIPNYTFPTGATINAVTGDFTWNCPGPRQGEYNIAILIHEWRRFGNQTFEVGQVLRDMQITVGSCDNNPPVIQTIPDYCVAAGANINFQVSATDADNDQITLSATGSPFQLNNSPAQFQQNVGVGIVFSDFSWSTICSHIKSTPYYVFFKAKDNGTPTNLVDYKTVTIKVVGPKPLNVNAQPQGTSMIITWTASTCSNVTGYKVYRKTGCSNQTPTDCETGMPSSWGYQLIGSTNGWSSTTFIDNNGGGGLIPGISYSYRVVANFPDGAESFVSDEDCAQLVRDIGVITHVSVLKTDLVNGIDSIAWTKPIGDENNLDTNAYPGPYEYKLYRASGIQGASFNLLKTFSSPTFYQLNDNNFKDTVVNTLSQGNNYKLEFYANGTLIGASKASSVFLSITPNDNRLTLNWQHVVPWINYNYNIFRKLPGSNSYQFLASTTTTEFSDQNLVNSSEYCYYITSEGSYSSPGITSPLFNNSQQACKSPFDFTAPCPPSFVNVEPDCEKNTVTVKWNNPNNSCTDDVIKYKLFTTSWDDTTTYQLIATINAQNDTLFIVDSLLENMAGCYALTALDSNSNESVRSASYCIDNCPQYELPNVFSPDKNTINDYFKPLPGWKYVKDIDLKIFDRWGKLVFTTNDPAIMWDGTNKDSKLLCNDGVYYYTCIINEKRLGGIVSRKVHGFVHIFSDPLGGD